jgi:uncharacterized glyoxalase superfamily protein PhnB
MSYRFSAMLDIPGDVRDAVAFYERAFGATTIGPLIAQTDTRVPPAALG